MFNRSPSARKGAQTPQQQRHGARYNEESTSSETSVSQLPARILPARMPENPQSGITVGGSNDDGEDGGDMGFDMSQLMMGQPEEPKTFVSRSVDPKLASYCEKESNIEIEVKKFTECTAVNFERWASRVHNAGHKLVVIRVDSPGGSVYALNRMLGAVETLKEQGVTVVTMCNGIAMSCGSILLAMGSKGHRYASKHSRVLVHQISGGVQGTLAGMRNELSEYEYDNRDLFVKIAKNAGLSDPNYYLNNVVTALNKDVFVHPYRAKLIGLIDHIGSPVIQKEVIVNYKVTLPGRQMTDSELREAIKEETALQSSARMDPLADIELPKFGPAGYTGLTSKSSASDAVTNTVAATDTTVLSMQFSSAQITSQQRIATELLY
jgi:ATP-dependent Clp endopeptidase proteolytic subunit ClpP